ncbi:MAG: NADP-dependent oxidoreductase [Acidimicrobiales bacterium]|nr:NADP-dependent oxidoreductase [Acidimicrobiales bacterium]RZV46997.1 MAG: NADP-dependent oxidoreductase [Acidimicrobiales bacterium]
MNESTEMMQAIITTPDGELEVASIPRPSPLASEVLIKISAIGVNPVDWKTKAATSPARARFAGVDPMILGWDIAGTVVAAGPGVTRFAVGDRVFGMPKFPHPANCYAEYVTSGARQVAKTPDNVSDLEAGAIPLAGLTAWQALVDTLKVSEGDRVLIHAASGGVGHLAVQIAKARGAEVWATASAAKHDLVRSLGADHLIDHHNERFEDVATDMDAIFDLYAMGDNPTRSVACLRRGGKMVVITPAAMPAPELIEAAGVSVTWMLVEPDYASLERLAEMMSNGSLTVTVGATRPLAQMAELHEIGEQGGPFGKLVATIG